MYIHKAKENYPQELIDRVDFDDSTSKKYWFLGTYNNNEDVFIFYINRNNEEEELEAISDVFGKELGLEKPKK
jgi:Zn-dependent peptidase ImmA (M78 family)